ncbi:MAG TPA: TetR/AcrR family transcriptional regulator [Bacteroidales bacterium]|nr:TetR/AcrR family transcriptional regulator [Bacteroidales bacterium]
MNDSREHILRTAFSLFTSKGYKAVTMQDLENATKLTKGAFYHYFKSKEELFQAVIEKYYLSSYPHFVAEDFDSLEAFIQAHVSNIQEKLVLMKGCGDNSLPDPYYLRLILEAKKHFPALGEKIKEIFRDQMNQWESIIVKAKNKGEIKKNVDASILAESFTSVGLGIIKNMILDDSVELALLKIKIQFEQLYCLLK